MSSSFNQGESVWAFNGAAVNHKNEEVDVLVLFVVLLNVSLGRGVVQNKSEFATLVNLSVDCNLLVEDLDGVVFIVALYDVVEGNDVVDWVDVLLDEYSGYVSIVDV